MFSLKYGRNLLILHHIPEIDTRYEQWLFFGGMVEIHPAGH